MPKNRQIIHPKQLSTTVPPPRSYTVMQFRSTQNEDDDDICPVCESECTCGNTNNSQPTPLPSPLTSASTPVPLKIKLPARTCWNLAEKLANLDGWVSKPKQTTADRHLVDGSSGSNDYVMVHRPSHLSTPGHQFGAPGPSGTASTTLSLRDSSPLTPEPELQPPPKAKRKSKQVTTKLASSNKKKAPIPSKAKPKSRSAISQKQLSIGARSRRSKDPAWKTNSIRRQGKKPIQTDESADNLTDEEAYVSGMAIDSDDTESVQFPTFVSAMSTTSDNDDSTSTMTDSFDSDSSIRAEEENLILSEQREKVRREILNNEESWHMEKRKWDHLKNNNNWEIRPRKRSVGPEEADGDTNSDSDSEMEAEEEEEEEGDDDEEADIQRYGHGMVTGWQSDDDDFDAELFFATLTDSSGPGSDADAEDGDCSGDEHSDNSDLSSISMREAAAAGLLSSFEADCPLVVTEDWDGKLVFANGLKDGQGVLDVHFEVDAAQRHRNICDAMEVDIDTEDTVERNEDDDEDEFISDDGGETTDDMLDHRSGISTPQGVPLPFRYPTPPVTSIDPLSTFSPIVGLRRSKTTKGVLDSPKPADILAGVGKMVCEGNNKDRNSVRSPTASVATSSSPDTSSSLSRQVPSMGSFKLIPADPKRRAIIDGTKTAVFSPFTRTKRAQRYPRRDKKRGAAGLDVFPYVSKRSRQSSLPGSSRAGLPVDGEGDTLVQSSPELPLPAASIGLDDVLDASFLDSDNSVEPVSNTSGERHFRNLSRWDRVPMSTFRRSRAAHMSDINVHVSCLGPPNDGVSYGSVSGHVLRKGPLGAALWQTSDKKAQSNPGSVTVSPVIFPVRDGYRSSSTFDQYPDLVDKPLPINPRTRKSYKQKRKEKKNRPSPVHNPSMSISTSNGFHEPLPIVPSLNL